MTSENIPFSILGGSGIRRPLLIIDIVNPHTKMKVRAGGIIDTGADACALPGSLAAALGHNVTKGRERTVGTGNGVTVAYEHTTSMIVMDPRDGHILAEIDNILIDYMPGLSTCLLGVRDFLEHFILTIDYPSKVFTLSR